MDQRMELAKNLSGRLIQKLTDLNEVEKVIVFTSEIIWSRELKHPKLNVQIDENRKPLKEKIDSVADWAYSMGAEQMMYLSIDLPLLEKEDIKEMIDSHEEGLTIVEAKKDGGTNALISDLPRRINFQFGTDSYQKHIEASKSEKLSINIQSIERLSFDLDDQDDWELLMKYYQPEKNPLEISN